MLEKKKRNLLILGIVFIGLMVFFTFADLNVALWIYNPESLFGRFFQIVGTLPLNIVGVFSTVALVMTAEYKFNLSTIVSYVLGALLLMFFGFYGCLSFANALPEGEIVITVATVGWVFLSIVLVGFIMKSGNTKALRKAAIIGVIGCAAAVFGPMMIKDFMSRPRFNTLENPVEQFTYWFQRMPQTATSSNSSFPSGHSAQSALSLCALLVPMFVKKWDNQKYYKAAGWIAGGFTVCVMVSRMVLGAHYGTDVLVGAMLTTTAIAIVDICLAKKEKLTEKGLSLDKR